MGFESIVGMLNKAWPSLPRGEFLPADEAFAEVAGLSKEAWLAKVEAYKVTRKKGPIMTYDVIFSPHVGQRLASWASRMPYFVEAYLQVTRNLADQPSLPFEGIVYHMTMVDPSNRFCEHSIYFNVVYAANEETIMVVNATYQRNDL